MITDVRQWVWDRLTTHIPLTDRIPVTQMYGSGSVSGNPSTKPFLTLNFGSTAPELNDGDVVAHESQFFSVWVYDEPGSYSLIDECLAVVRAALCGRDDVICLFQGDSTDLADEDYGALTKNSTYKLVGGS